jgi:hypothetical protein
MMLRVLSYTCAVSLLLLLHAALVKVLRRCVRDMASKSSAFVELCVKTEKEAAQEVGCLHTQHHSSSSKETSQFCCNLVGNSTQHAARTLHLQISLCACMP